MSGILPQLALGENGKILGQLRKCQQAKLVEWPTNNCTLEGLNPATAGAGCKWQKYLIDLESGRSAV